MSFCQWSPKTRWWVHIYIMHYRVGYQFGWSIAEREILNCQIYAFQKQSTILCRDIRECNRPEINLFSDISFANFRGTLNAEGMGVVKHTENLTIKDAIELWEKGIIIKRTAKVYFSTTLRSLDCAISVIINNTRLNNLLLAKVTLLSMSSCQKLLNVA